MLIYTIWRNMGGGGYKYKVYVLSFAQLLDGTRLIEDEG